MDPSEILRYIQVAVGIGLVIFVHEAGHFLAARLCGVRVEIFSLGFGPRIFGFRRGSTLYQIALIPLGGFVKMAGEETGDSSAPAPDDLRAKSVGQRFLIYSGGVLMNVAFGLVVFPIILTSGVPFVEPVIGRALPGGPAWEARLAPGTRVLSIDGHECVGFLSIANEVALSSAEGVDLLILDPGAQNPRRVRLQPKFRPSLGFSTIDVDKPLDPENKVRVLEGSTADRAGLRTGDRLLALEDGLIGLDLPRQIEWRMDRGLPLALQVEGVDGTMRRVLVGPESTTAGSQRRLGVQPIFNLVSALRDNPRVDELGLRQGDHVLRAGDQPIVRSGDLVAALIDHAKRSAPLFLRIERNGQELDLTAGPLTAEEAVLLAEDVALAIDPDSTRIAVAPGSPAAAVGLLDGDRVERIDGVPTDSWSTLQRLTHDAARQNASLVLNVHRMVGSELRSLEIEATPASIPLPSYGFGIEDALYVYRADNLLQAVRLGMSHSAKFMIDAWTTLKRIGQGRVSGENIGGIITIASVSYSWTALGLSKLLFFLCVLSLNLAFINVLPIPVLDGGHLFFLLVEKIKGSPVSERVFGYSQLVGMVMILTLMIYVMYNDIMRFIPPN